MQPTNKLRYVQRGWKNVYSYDNMGKELNFVLQQWWEEQRNEITPPPGIQPIFRSPARGEWRDIPIEVEE